MTSSNTPHQLSETITVDDLQRLINETVANSTRDPAATMKILTRDTPQVPSPVVLGANLDAACKAFAANIKLPIYTSDSEAHALFMLAACTGDARATAKFYSATYGVSMPIVTFARLKNYLPSMQKLTTRDAALRMCSIGQKFVQMHMAPLWLQQEASAASAAVGMQQALAGIIPNARAEQLDAWHDFLHTAAALGTSHAVLEEMVDLIGAANHSKTQKKRSLAIAAHVKQTDGAVCSFHRDEAAWRVLMQATILAADNQHQPAGSMMLELHDSKNDKQ